MSALHRRAALAALAGVVLGGSAAAAPLAPSGAFDFVALGDLPYGPDLMVGPAYRRLIDLINQAAPAFSLHVGDFKDGLAACDDAEYQRQWQHFQRFAGAVVYTPGDNDWLDCERRGDDPLERLQALRQRFFDRPQSLGQRPIALQRQADGPPPAAPYPENQRWQHAGGDGPGVVFATFHTVGPDNGLARSRRPAVQREARAREAANAAWIRQAFDLAQQQRAPALVLATQAEPLVYPDRGRPRRGVVSPAFALSVRDTLLPLAAAAPFPVLLVHGDDHRHLTDRPFLDATGRPIANLWRLQVFGAPRAHAVRVRVQPGVAGQPPFAYAPIFNPASGDPRVGTGRSP